MADNIIKDAENAFDADKTKVQSEIDKAKNVESEVINTKDQVMKEFQDKKEEVDQWIDNIPLWMKILAGLIVLGITYLSLSSC